MNKAFIVLLVMCGIELLVAANMHGKPRDNVDFFDTAFSVAIIILIFLCGIDFNLYE